MKTDYLFQQDRSFLKYLLFIKGKITCLLGMSFISSIFLISAVANAQVVPDGTTSTTVDGDGSDFTINQGDRSGNNLFHSFQDFSVPNGGSATFNNADSIQNIFSRVTGGNISQIDGLLGANGSANLFLVNPAGIIFGEGASLDVGGSFLGSTADSILFSDGMEFSATDAQTKPILTINAPIGLNFRDNPGNIINRSLDGETLIGLEVLADKTLALIGGDLLIEGGILSTERGRIELGSVDANNTVNITPINKGFDFSYEDIFDFRDINLNSAAFVYSLGENAGDIQVTGRNISLIEGSQIGIDNEFSGRAADLEVIASESLELDGNAAEVDLGDFETLLFNNIVNEVRGEGSQILIEAPRLTVSNGSRISASSAGSGIGVDIFVNADDIFVATPFTDSELNILRPVGIFTRVDTDGLGNGGNITIETDTLTLNEGGQIATDTFGSGDAGDLTVNADKSIEIVGDTEFFPSNISTNVGDEATATGNGGNLTLNTSRLVVQDGAQIATVARQGNGGTLIIDAESILLSGTSPLEEAGGTSRGGIILSVQPAFEAESGETIFSTGNAGTLNLTAGELVIERGAGITLNTFSQGEGGNGNINVNNLLVRSGGRISAGSLVEANSIAPNNRGDGGTLDITASESVEITGTGDINGETVNDGLFTLAQSDGDAGNITLTTDNLTVSDGGEINASGSGLGAAGNLTITANSLNLDRGTLTAATASGTGGNITLQIDNTITLSSNSLISAAATGNANGGNLSIDSNFVVAFQGNNDIIARAAQGQGGNIAITAESVLGIQERPLNPFTNDINASSEFGLDGAISLDTPDLNPLQGATELPVSIVQPSETTQQACAANREAAAKNGLDITGKGGVPPAPELPLNSLNTIIDGKVNPVPTIPAPIETSQGKIQLARGIKVTEEGISLVAYRTDNNGDRLIDVETNCE